MVVFHADKCQPDLLSHRAPLGIFSRCKCLGSPSLFGQIEVEVEVFAASVLTCRPDSTKRETSAHLHVTKTTPELLGASNVISPAEWFSQPLFRVNKAHRPSEHRIHEYGPLYKYTVCAPIRPARRLFAFCARITPQQPLCSFVMDKESQIFDPDGDLLLSTIS